MSDMSMMDPDSIREALRGTRIQHGSLVKCQDAAVREYVLKANQASTPQLLAYDGVLGTRALFVTESQVPKAKKELQTLLNPSSRKKVTRRITYDALSDNE